MASKRWTDEAIRALRPDDGKGMQWFAIGDGLMVYVRRAKAGEPSRHWYARVQVHGKRLSQRLGDYPRMSLAQARRRVAEVMAEAERARINAEQHPVQARRSEVERKLTEPTVAEFFEQVFIPATRDGKRSRTGRPVRERTIHLAREPFEADIAPVMGNLKLRHVTRAHCEECIARPMQGRGGPGGKRTVPAPGMAAQVYKTLAAIFRYADEVEAIDADPMRRVRKPKAGGADERIRVATDGDLRRLLRAMDESKRLSASVRLAVRWILLTGCRPGEARLARWGQINQTNGTWHLESADKKEGRRFTVRLSTQAMRVLSEAATLRAERAQRLGVKPGPEDPIFPGRTQGGLEKNAINHALRRTSEEAGVERLAPHDLRRTCRTIMARVGVDGAIGDRCLNHKVGGVLAALYDGHDYAAEMASAWARVGAHLDVLMAGGAEVVPIRAAAGA